MSFSTPIFATARPLYEILRKEKFVPLKPCRFSTVHHSPVLSVQQHRPYSWQIFPPFFLFLCSSFHLNLQLGKNLSFWPLTWSNKLNVACFYSRTEVLTSISMISPMRKERMHTTSKKSSLRFLRRNTVGNISTMAVTRLSTHTNFIKEKKKKKKKKTKMWHQIGEELHEAVMIRWTHLSGHGAFKT